MPKIFISYRRADTRDVTERIHDHMIMHFGEENVFLDVDDIPPGVDFRVYLAKQIEQVDTVLVIIGPDWAHIMQERANQENDFVRIEVESALAQGKFVIPVLVGEADVPDWDKLPEVIAALGWKNVATIRRNPHHRQDCVRLADWIVEYFENLKANFLPQPFEWLDIPAGQVALTQTGGYLEEPTSFDVPAFIIAKYPITMAQYATFTNENYDLNKADHPVVKISWFEAMDFCSWFSEATSLSITLPTEQQWQRAAQGDTSWKYPWGDEFDTGRCNTDESNISTTTPVTKYPHGASPYGVMDMSGNVWEMCLTDIETGSNDKDTSNRNGCVLRGGSYYNNQRHALSSYRIDYCLPQFPIHYNGFRVVCIP